MKEAQNDPDHRQRLWGMVNWTPAELIQYAAKGAASRPAQPGYFERVEREAKLHDAIESYCRSQGWLYVHSRMDKRSTQAIGVWDFIVFLPGGITLAVECKKGREKLTLAQQAFGAWLTKLGHRTVIARSLEDFVRATKDGFTDAMIAAGREG